MNQNNKMALLQVLAHLIQEETMMKYLKETVKNYL